jgi:uncharacterized protein
VPLAWRAIGTENGGMTAKSLLWRRLDTAGAEHALVDDARGLTGHGTILANAPVPYTLTYELQTDEQWASGRLAVRAEGVGWQRTVTLERAVGRWRVTAGERGDLDKALVSAGRARLLLPGADDPDTLDPALDIDLGFSPLTNTLPIRRLGLLGKPAGTSATITAAWVLVPALTVVAAQQSYTVLGGDRIRYSSGSFTAELTVDEQGYVIDYPGLATRR